MSNLPEFERGQPVFLAPSGADAERGVRAVIEAIQDRRLIVAAVDDDRLDFVFPERSTAWVSFLTPTGIYILDATVVRAGEMSLALDLPDDVNRVQRRQHVRVDVALAATCLLLDERSNRFTPFDAEVTDVGGGGIALAADVIAPQHATVVLSLAVPDDRPVVAIGSVLATDRERGDDGRRSRYVLRVQFTLIAEAERDRLIRWIFANLRRRAKESS